MLQQASCEQFSTRTVADHAGWRALVESARAISHARMLVAVVSTSCQYCIDSMGFYRTLLDASQHSSGRWHFVLAAAEPTDTLRRLASAHGLSTARLISFSLASSDIRQTPTLAVVDADGNIERVWGGVLPRASEDAVRAQMER